MNLKRFYDAVLYFIILPASAISFLLTPLQNDARIFFGVEHIADAFYQFPSGLDLAWEIKPIGNRIINWSLYKLASLFVSINNPVMFGVAIKVFALIAVVIVSVYFASIIKSRYAFPLTFLALVAVGNISVIQPEWWATVLGLVILALMLNDDRENMDIRFFVAGLLIIPMGLIKGVTIVMIIPILCAVILLEPDGYNKLRNCIVELAGGIIVFALLFLSNQPILLPHFYSDILMSMPIAYIGVIPVTTLIHFAVMGIPISLPQMPIVAAGLVIAVWYIITHHRNISTIVLIAAMWLVPFATIVIQPALMIYHYYLLTIPALVTILMMEIEK
jgi:hypothetical protein